MKYILLLLILIVMVACSPSTPVTSQGRYTKAIEDLESAKSEEKRFYALNDAAKEAFNLEKFKEAEQYALQLQTLAPQFKNNWNYGNAVQDFNIVLGRLALKKGDLNQAKAHLLAAGNSPGSPQMDTFGPNMSLAKDLLDAGEREVVLNYFDLCQKF